MYRSGSVRIVTLVLSILTFKMASLNPTKSLALQGFLPMTGSSWTAGGACLPAVLMALRHVNERPGLLDGYNLTYTWVDTQCNAGIATYKMFQALSKPPTKVMLLGCGCSIASEATAQVSYLYNVTQLSYASLSPTLSDEQRFPNFYRLMGPDNKLNPAKIAFMREFNWEKVATINQALEFFSLVIDDFVQHVKGTNVTIISQEIFQHDPLTRLQNLKNHDARIIIVACYEDKAKLLFCHAYKLGLYGPKIVWIIASWYSSEFWRQNLDDVPCTAEEMDEVADGVFLFGFTFMNGKDERGIAGLTVSEFFAQYRLEEEYNETNSSFESFAPMCYDHVWVAGLVLNCTDNYLRANGYPKSIDAFSYEDSVINDVILACMANVSFIGVSGRISFGQGADPEKNIIIERIQDGKRAVVGTYITEQIPAHFEWNTGGLIWKDGHTPRDSTYVIYEELSIPLWLYATVTAFAGTGIIVAFFLFVFNIINRENRAVRLSSPGINNIMLLGCVLINISVFIPTTRHAISAFCKIQTYCLTLGFTLAFGALFSKTWRVYKIFTKNKQKKMDIEDCHLIGLICGMSSAMVVILVVWEIIGPQLIVTKELTEQVYRVGNDAEIRPFVRICYSNYGTHFTWTIYIIEAAWLTFGIFFVWVTRHVKIVELNDTRQTGMCLYNILVISAIGLLFSCLLEERIVMVYGIRSGCVIVGNFLTQAIIFVPKVLTVYGRCTSNIHPMETRRGTRALVTHSSARKTSTAASACT